MGQLLGATAVLDDILNVGSNMIDIFNDAFIALTTHAKIHSCGIAIILKSGSGLTIGKHGGI